MKNGLRRARSDGGFYEKEASIQSIKRDFRKEIPILTSFFPWLECWIHTKLQSCHYEEPFDFAQD